MTWTIWYGDGSIVTSATSSWADAPRDNVQVVMVYRDGDRGRMAACGADSYVLLEDRQEVWGVDLPLPELHAVAEQLAAAGRLKFGGRIAPAAYAAIRDQAYATYE